MNRNIETINYLLKTIRYYQYIKTQETDKELNKKYDNIIGVFQAELNNEFELLKNGNGNHIVKYATDNYKDTSLLDEIMCLVEMIRHYEYVGDPLAIDYRKELEKFLFNIIG